MRNCCAVLVLTLLMARSDGAERLILSWPDSFEGMKPVEAVITPGNTTIKDLWYFGTPIAHGHEAQIRVCERQGEGDRLLVLRQESGPSKSFRLILFGDSDGNKISFESGDRFDIALEYFQTNSSPRLEFILPVDTRILWSAKPDGKFRNQERDGVLESFHYDLSRHPGWHTFECSFEIEEGEGSLGMALSPNAFEPVKGGQEVAIRRWDIWKSHE